MSSERVSDLQAGAETIELSGEDPGTSLQDLRLGGAFSAATPKHTPQKHRTDKLNFIENKSFCSSKDSNEKVRRQLREWERIFATRASDKGLISRTYKEALNSKIKRQIIWV